jgi:hypothetical protein
MRGQLLNLADQYDREAETQEIRQRFVAQEPRSRD